MKPSVAVIIPTFNRKECLRNVLECISNQHPGNFCILPVVINDGSTDGTEELMKSDFPEVYTIQGDGNWWYTKCINEGIKYALSINADYVLTLNDDIQFHPDYVERLFEVVETEGPDCIVGSVSYTISTPHRITFSGIHKVIRWRLKEINYIKKFSVVDPESLTGYKLSANLSGRGILIPLNSIKHLGYYDARLVQYGSDTDFTYRAYKAGINVLISYDAMIFENERLTSKADLYNKPRFSVYLRSFFSNYSSNSINKSVYFYTKHGYIVLLPFYFIYLIFGSLVTFFVKYSRTD